MAIVISVRFKDSGRIYYFDPGELKLRVGEMVIVDTIHGPELAKVVYEQCDIPSEEVIGELKSVLRRADPEECTAASSMSYDYDEIMAVCNQKIFEHDLDMRLVKAEYNFYGSRLTFYFTSEQRVDFRALVRDLARTFKTRIELRQIGPRDEAKLLGGIGMCGRLLCCSTFLPDYTRVSIRMAKDQELPLNPAKISGVCNRLLCCLSYEHQQYVELKEGLPRRGTWVKTVDGRGQIVDINILQQRVTVQLAHSGMQEHYAITDVQEIPAPREKVQGTTDGDYEGIARRKGVGDADPAMKQSTGLDSSDDKVDVLDILDEEDISILEEYDLDALINIRRPGSVSVSKDEMLSRIVTPSSIQSPSQSDDPADRRRSPNRRRRRRSPEAHKKTQGEAPSTKQPESSSKSRGRRRSGKKSGGGSSI